MDLGFCIKQLNDQSQAIKSLVGNVSPQQATWKPDLDTWSLLEVMNHLYFEERRDFRSHLEKYPSPTADEWPPIDQPGAEERTYDLENLSDTLQGFLDERQKSIAWLQHLTTADWEAKLEVSFVNSSMTFRMGEMLASWVAHDLLHIRQLVELHWAYTTWSVQPYSVAYAGGW